MLKLIKVEDQSQLSETELRKLIDGVDILIEVARENGEKISCAVYRNIRFKLKMQLDRIIENDSALHA